MRNLGLYAGLGVAALGAGYLFFTKDGKALIDGFMDSIGGLGGDGGLDFEGISKSAIDAGYDDPFKYMKGSKASAWDPTSDLYKKIQKRADRNAKSRKRLQKHYIESYIANAYT